MSHMLRCSQRPGVRVSYTPAYAMGLAKRQRAEREAKEATEMPTDPTRLSELAAKWRKYVYDTPPIDSFGNGHNTARGQDAEDLEATLAADPQVAVSALLDGNQFWWRCKIVNCRGMGYATVTEGENRPHESWCPLVAAVAAGGDADA